MTDRHQTKPYPLRMSDELRAKLEESAKVSGRSVNAEILHRLDLSYIASATRSPEQDARLESELAEFQTVAKKMLAAIEDNERIKSQMLEQAEFLSKLYKNPPKIEKPSRPTRRK